MVTDNLIPLTSPVQMIMRSELLDELTCDICRDELDGIVLPTEDPRWAGPLGQLAHPHCRAVWVPIFEGIEPVLRPTPEDDIPSLVRHAAGLLTRVAYDGGEVPEAGRERWRRRPLLAKDLIDLMEPIDLIARLLGLKDIP